MKGLDDKEFELFRRFNSGEYRKLTRANSFLFTGHDHNDYDEQFKKTLINEQKLLEESISIGIKLKKGRDCSLDFKQKLTIIMKATHKCNLKCPYCYDFKNRCESEGKEDMSVETVKNILKVFGDRIGVIIWHGGEPLTVPLDKIREINDIIKAYNPDIDILMQTNGTLITQDTINVFNKYGMRPGLSFDGIKNELTRKSTVRLMKTFKLLKKNDMSFGAIVILTPDNIKDIIAEYEYAKMLGLNINMNLIFSAEGNDKSLNMDYEVMSKYICEFFDYWIKDKDDPVNSALCEMYLSMLLETGNRLCQNGDCVGKWFGVYPNGDIQPCGRDWGESMTFGNINTINNIDDITTHDNYMRYKTQTRCLNAKCAKNCVYSYGCGSGCNGTTHNAHANFESPEENYCKSTKLILTHIFNTIKDIDPNDIDQALNYNHLFINYLLRNRYRNMQHIKKVLKYKGEML